MATLTRPWLSESLLLHKQHHNFAGQLKTATRSFGCSSPSHTSALVSRQEANPSYSCLSSCKREVAQSCPTLCDTMDCSLPGSSVHEILQARVLEWVATPSSTGSSQPRDRTQVSRIAGRCFTVRTTREALTYLTQCNSNFQYESYGKKEIGMISLCKSLSEGNTAKNK